MAPTRSSGSHTSNPIHSLEEKTNSHPAPWKKRPPSPTYKPFSIRWGVNAVYVYAFFLVIHNSTNGVVGTLPSNDLREHHLTSAERQSNDWLISQTRNSECVICLFIWLFILHTFVKLIGCIGRTERLAIRINIQRSVSNENENKHWIPIHACSTCILCWHIWFSFLRLIICANMGIE